MRIALTVLVAEMLTWPYLKIIGGLLLLYIGVSLILDDDSEEGAPAGRPLAVRRGAHDPGRRPVMSPTTCWR